MAVVVPAPAPRVAATPPKQLSSTLHSDGGTSPSKPGSAFHAGSPHALGSDGPNSNAMGLASPSNAVPVQRIKDILGSLQFFQAMGASLQEKLALVTSSAHYPAGTVIFQEGDPAGNCYVILSGKLGIYNSSVEEEEAEHDGRQRPATPQGTAGRRRSTSVDPSSRRSSACTRLEKRDSVTAISDEGLLSAAPGTPQDGSVRVRPQLFKSSRRSFMSLGFGLQGAVELPPQKTVEGFSTYTSSTNFGRCVNQMGKGELLGELALLHDSSRSASAKCLQEVELLIIGRREFDQICKEELKHADEHKLSFLQEHVPGMRGARCVRGKPHAAYNFRQATFSKGHTFMQQGAPTKECVYVVTKGTVQVAFRDHVTPTDQVHKLSTLLPGGFFGSLPTFAAPAPFSVVVVSGAVEVFYANSEDVWRMPRRLVEDMREYLAQATMWHLRKLKQSRAAKEGAIAAIAAAKKNPFPALKPITVLPSTLPPPQGRKLRTQHSLPNIGAGCGDVSGGGCSPGGASPVRPRSRMMDSGGRLPLVS